MADFHSRAYAAKGNILRLNVLVSASEWRTWLRKFETASSHKFIVKRNYFWHYIGLTNFTKVQIRPACKSTLGRVDGTSRSAISTTDDLVLLVLKAQLIAKIIEHPAWLSNSQTKLLLHYGVRYI